MIRACLALLAGMYAPQLSSFAVQYDQVDHVLAASLLLLAIRRTRYLGCFLAGVGLFASAVYTVVESRIDERFVGDSIVTSIRIADFPRERPNSVVFIAHNLEETRLPRRIRISWYDPPVRLYPDDTWRVELRLRRPRSTSNAGGFDFESWLTREQVGAVGYVVNGPRNELLRTRARSPIQALRQRFVSRVTALLPDIESAAVLAALVVGTRHLLSDVQWDRYARSGTSHLMAISGLHIGLAAVSGYLLARGLVTLAVWRGNHHAFAIAAGMLVAVLYALVSGGAVPARRASLMIVFAGLALLRHRQPCAWRILCLVATLIVTVTPLATMAPGFKLSFAAVAALLWLARRYEHQDALPWWSPRRLRTGLRSLGVAQVLLFFGLLPMSVLIFDRIVLAAPWVNLVAVPVFSLVTVPLALTGMVFDGFLQPAGDWALLAAALSIAGIEYVIAMAASLSWAARSVPSIDGIAWLYVILPLVWVVTPPGWPGRRLAWIGFAALMLHVPARPEAGCAVVHVLDVGQGLATVVETRRSVLVFDTGPSFRGGGSSAESVVMPFLASRGIKRIDKLVVSHADLDHAGGVPVILKTVDVGEVIYGEWVATGGTASRYCVAGESWQQDGVRFRFLHPGADASFVGNDASCVLQVEAGQRRLLLTGDIERAAEMSLLQSRSLETVDVVVVPHHGSRTSSSAAFVSALRPGLAIVSAGFGNRWGFPKPEIVTRWRTAGSEVLATATSGAVSLHACADAKPIVSRRYRPARRRIWHE
jgi:competence protein ComEC